MVANRRHWAKLPCFALAILLWSLSLACSHAAAAIPDFGFIQISDIHSPMTQSADTISAVKQVTDLQLSAYGVTVPKPAFVLATGDLTEFGGGSGYWQTYLSYWKDAPYPVYNTLGNHDNTWHACLQDLRTIGQKPYYSFDYNGCHFVGLMTATIQDPRPSIGEEQIRWLESDLRRIGRNTPVFVFFHHPLGGSEFASRYDYNRLLDVLRDYNTVLLMAGHSHGNVYRAFEGWDQVTGGSTFGPTTGMMYYSIQNGVLRAAYRKLPEPTASLKILEKPIPEAAPYPRIEITSPAARGTIGATLKLSARITGPANVQKAVYTVDDNLKGDLSLTGSGPTWAADGNIDVSALTPGAHYARVTFDDGARQHSRSTQFFYEPAEKPTAWRAYLASAGKACPTIANGVVYVGANDGLLRAFDARTGSSLWSVDTGAEILAQPLVAQGKVYVANGLGLVIAYDISGKKQWSFTADEAVYSSPVYADGKVIFGSLSGKLIALDAATGSQVWTNEDAGYAVESKPFVWGDRVYYGAWDQYVRCVDVKAGQLIWKQMGEGSATQAAKRYYSPADCGPIVVDGKLMVADRNYSLTIFDATTGDRVTAMKAVSAVGLSEDGHSAYLRKTSGELVKVDAAGATLWSVPAQMDFLPVPPVEKDGVVYVAGGKGLVSAVSAQDGKILWQYQASPQLFVMAPVAADGSRAYVVSFDGSLTAIKAVRGTQRSGTKNDE